MNNDELKESLIKLFTSRTAGPFLFIGSGFSRRYLGLCDWKSLLEKYCIFGRPFEYYLATGDSTYPTAARLIAEDFNKEWWNDEKFAGSREKYSKKVIDNTSALRYEICDYLMNSLNVSLVDNPYYNEIELLSNLNVDGIITTNWDCFLEQLFPDYKVYTGQNELLFSNPQSIAEIYKIHGSAHKPKTLIMTDDDYNEFNLKNPYLAAKLITIFVEHPVIFVGYSLSDKNVTSLLSAISTCIGKDNIEQLQHNLIFIEREEGLKDISISNTYTSIDRVQIPITLIRTDDFIPIYEAIEENKRKIPARILRYCKEQLYSLVQSSEPEKKICVVDIDEVEKHADVEFVVGVGVAEAKRKEFEIGGCGYTQISNLNLFHDLLHEDGKYDSRSVLESVVPAIGRYTPNVVVFKYLNALDIKNEDDYLFSGLNLEKWVERSDVTYQTRGYFRSFVKKFKDKDTNYIINHNTPETAAIYLPFLFDKLDLEIVKRFLIQHEEKLDSEKSSYASYFRKLACLYDKLKYGW
ncbi:SIR2 family protein [Kosakonia sacchari]|uniref:SIR2 family protein n=1 Tax=Kosakonia sacchari TaxID=1158459 RepID=UPI0025B02D83|nr:SIR2 family protein [Kosakonia sacchari]MDN2486871.1 SIR2 family protein [Kosakonia sacchari]